jgi:thiosulfate reductase cytochrome b subunit
MRDQWGRRYVTSQKIIFFVKKVQTTWEDVWRQCWKNEAVKGKQIPSILTVTGWFLFLLLLIEYCCSWHYLCLRLRFYRCPVSPCRFLLRRILLSLLVFTTSCNEQRGYTTSHWEFPSPIMDARR